MYHGNVLIGELRQGDKILKSGMFMFKYGAKFPDLCQNLVNLVRKAAMKTVGSKGTIEVGGDGEIFLLYECDDKGKQTGGSWKVDDSGVMVEEHMNLAV
jgi:hypothetical protein